MLAGNNLAPTMDPFETIDAIFEQLQQQLDSSSRSEDRRMSLEFAKRSVMCVALYTHVHDFNVITDLPENILPSS